MDNKHARYLPQIRLEEIGKDGQNKLSNSSVLIIGCGALGSPVAMYLAGAGVGRLVLADFDTIDPSNLHRQIFYNENEVGDLKALCLKKRISQLNSDIKVDIVTKFVTAKILAEIASQIDVIVDAADNPSTTYMLDKYCKEKAIPLSIAGVSAWNAQIFTYIPGSFTYSDIFTPPVNDEGLLPCSVSGIIGPVAGIAASFQALEVIKILTGNSVKKSRLISADFLNIIINTF